MGDAGEGWTFLELDVAAAAIDFGKVGGAKEAADETAAYAATVVLDFWG